VKELGIVLYAGGPCCCRPNRYIRYIVPPVPGCTPAIYCRDNEAGTEGKATHAIPRGAVLVVRAPQMVDGAHR
jgi:hypothetical protein